MTRSRRNYLLLPGGKAVRNCTFRLTQGAISHYSLQIGIEWIACTGWFEQFRSAALAVLLNTRTFVISVVRLHS